MNVRRHCAVLVVVVLLCAGSPVRAAKKNVPKPNPKSNANLAAQARNAVTDAQRHVSDASTQLGLARARLQQAIKQAGQVRSEVEKEHDSAPGLQASRRLLDEHRHDVEQLKQDVREKLASNVSYQEAITARDENKKRLAALPEGQNSEKSAVERAFNESNSRVRQLENEAFAANAKVKAAIDDSNREEADLRELVKKRDAEIQSDSRLASTKGEIQQAKAAVAAAEQMFQAATQRLVIAEQAFAQRLVSQRANASRSRRPARGW